MWREVLTFSYALISDGVTVGLLIRTDMPRKTFYLLNKNSQTKKTKHFSPSLLQWTIFQEYSTVALNGRTVHRCYPILQGRSTAQNPLALSMASVLCPCGHKEGDSVCRLLLRGYTLRLLIIMRVDDRYRALCARKASNRDLSEHAPNNTTAQHSTA